MRSPGRSRWLILALFLALGVAMTAWEPTRVTAIGPLWLLGSIAIAAFYLLMVVRAKRHQRLRRTGVAAQAVARSLRETGLYVHEMPQVEMELDVQAPGGGYSVAKRMIVPLGAVEGLKRGDPFAVRVDPGDRDELAFDWGEIEGPAASWIARGHGAPAEMDAATRLAELEQLRANSDMTEAQYRELKAEIEPSRDRNGPDRGRNRDLTPSWPCGTIPRSWATR